MERPAFTPGRNIALKIPPHQYEATVAFYRDTLGLRALPEHAPYAVFEFGVMRLWVDRVATLSQAQVWLEVRAPDPEAAGAWLASRGVVRCDEVEELPRGFSGFWILNPASLVHLVAGDAED